MHNTLFSFFTRTAQVEDNCRRYFEEDWRRGMMALIEDDHNSPLPSSAYNLKDEGIPF